MKIKSAAAITILLMSIFGVSVAAFPVVEQEDGITISTENPEDYLDYDMSTGVGVVSGVTVIEYRDMKARGMNLAFNEKTGVASMMGAPAVYATIGENMDAEFGKIAFDMDRQLLFASGGCRINSWGASGTTKVVTEGVVIHTEKKWLRTDSEVSIDYTPPQDKTKEDAETPVDGEDGAEGAEGADKTPNEIDKLGEINITSGPIYYETRSGVLSATGPVRMEFSEGYLEAGSLSGNIETKVFSLEGGISGKAGDTEVTANRADMDYQKEEMTASGNVHAHQTESGLTITAAKVWIKFAEDDRRMKASEINMEMNLKRKQSQQAGESGPKGDTP